MPLSDSELRLIAGDPDLVGKLSDADRKRLSTLKVAPPKVGLDPVLRLANQLGKQEQEKAQASPESAAPKKPAAGKEEKGAATVQLEEARTTLAGYAKKVLEAPGQLVIGALESLRETDTSDIAGGVQTLRLLATPGSAENAALLKSLIPKTPEAQALGEGIVQGALDELDRGKRFLKDPAKVAREEPGGVAMLGLDVAGGAGVVSALTRAGKSKGLIKAVTEQAGGVKGQALNYMDELERAGVAITSDEALRATTARDIFSVLPDGPATILDPAPRPHGAVARWIRQFPDDPVKGQVSFDEFRRANDLIRYGDRVIALRNRAFFDQTPTRKLLGKFGVADTLKPGDTNDLMGLLRGVRLDEKGQVQFGAIARAGVIDLPTKISERLRVLGENPAGKLLPDGRIVGTPHPEFPDAIRLYRVISPDDARAAYNDFVKRGPKQKQVLDQIMAAKEDPVVIAGGQRMPAMSRAALKEQYGITGLTAEESAHASALAREAIPGSTVAASPLEFNWVPESVSKKPNLLSGFRNGLNHVTAPTRRFKSGAAFEKAFQGGEDIDFAAALTKTQKELFAEPIRNDAAASILSMAAVPLKAGDTIPTGWRLFNTGLYGDSQTFRKFVAKKREVFAKQGIDVDALVDESFRVRGRAYIIPDKVGKELGVWFDRAAVDANPRFRAMSEAFDKAAGEILAIPGAFWLSRPSSAFRNFRSQALTFAPKAMRDAYSAMIQTAIPSMRFQELPWQDFFSDFVGLYRAHKSAATGTAIPTELLGGTFASQFELSRPSTAAAKVLRVNGFNYADVSWKRTIVEGVVDSTAKNSWAILERKGLTKGMTRDEFLKRWRANIPKSVMNTALREMDIWGGYDYNNIPAAIETIKRSKALRGAMPYPTYYYKLVANTYGELFGPQNLTNLVSSRTSQAQKVQAMANMMAGATIAGVAFSLVDDAGDLVGDMKDSLFKAIAERAERESGRKIKESDLPVDVDRFGRIQVPLKDEWKERMGLLESESMWIREYDMPFVGEAMAAKAIWGGRYGVREYLNDRISKGPLYTSVAIVAGLSDRYNAHLTEGTRVGKLAADMMPFSNESRLARQLSDLDKREAGSESKSSFRNFMEGFADNYPVLSTFLTERVRTADLSIPKYSRANTLASYLLVNSRVVDEKVRDAEIAAAGLALLEDTRDELSRDIIREEVKKIEDAMGQTVPGQVKRAISLSPGEIATKTEQVFNAIHITRAYRDGGLTEGLRVARDRLQNVDESVPKAARSALARSAKELLERLEMQGKNMTLQVLKDAPSRSRMAGMEQLQTLEPENELLKFLPKEAP